MSSDELEPLPGHLDLPQSHVDRLRARLAGPGMNHDWWVRMLLAYGREFEPSPLPDDVPVMQPHCCYLNSFTLAAGEPDRFTYYEGFGVMSKNNGWGTQHAWCVDACGRVVDATWPNVKSDIAAGYIGLPLPLEVVEPYATFESHGTLHHLYRDRREWMKSELPRLLGVEPL